MKIADRSVHRAARVALSLALWPLALGVASAANPAPTSGTSSAPKTHVLFMGADIALKQDQDFHRVEDVTATALVIKPGGKRVEVPLSRGGDVFITEALKIASSSVGINDLKAERAYTPLADPFRKIAQAAALTAGQTAVTDLQQGALLRAQTGVMGANIVLNAVRGTPNEGWGQKAVADAEATQAQATSDLVQAYNTPSPEAYDVGSRSVAVGVESSREMFDAIRVTFDVKPERDLAQPYYAVIAQIREHDSKPGQVRKWAYVKSLGPIAAGVPTSVTVYQGGFPSGYILEHCEVHLYNQGQELATNLSRKRVPLTDDEVMEFRIVDYIGANKGRSLPPSPASLMVASAVRASLTPAQLSQTCYVRVTKAGRVTAAFSDAAGKQPMDDAALVAALKTLRFKPALAAGKPIESIAPITIDQFASP